MSVIPNIASRIIYGTAWKKERTTALVISAVLKGFRAIDTACQPKHYREDLVGQALVELKEKHGLKREDLWIQTKFSPVSGQDTTQPIPYNPSDPIRKQIIASFTKSLTNLHTTYLDSYLLHSPLQTDQQTLEAWQTLSTLQDEGKVKLIGVSNTYDVRILATLCKVRKVQVVQNRWYEGNGWDKSVFGFCKEHGIMYQSFWTLSGSPSLLSNPALLSIAATSECTPEQAVFKLAQEAGVTPLTGTTSEIHMGEDLRVHKLQLAKEGLGKEYGVVSSMLIGQ
ncbi:Aldo/keto reductase [Macrolepiota fuliginosa MF-IS2]|uniref:Aldo/keto reductase n=1 Tax=Macrolepiota fuliginosa MF-IS2 TaxID=1400762 RepID=A0A9P6C2J0_9AGAR|nr:Aldo/keto reductase [Macrolepiota fuliginosa MF-IS2]